MRAEASRTTLKDLQPVATTALKIIGVVVLLCTGNIFMCGIAFWWYYKYQQSQVKRHTSILYYIVRYFPPLSLFTLRYGTLYPLPFPHNIFPSVFCILLLVVLINNINHRRLLKDWLRPRLQQRQKR